MWNFETKEWDLNKIHKEFEIEDLTYRCMRHSLNMKSLKRLHNLNKNLPMKWKFDKKVLREYKKAIKAESNMISPFNVFPYAHNGEKVWISYETLQRFARGYKHLINILEKGLILRERLESYFNSGEEICDKDEVLAGYCYFEDYAKLAHNRIIQSKGVMSRVEVIEIIERDV